MRFYIHHDGDPEFTLAVSWAPTDRRAVRDLCALVAKRLPATAGTRHISLVTENGVELPAGHCVCACVREGADLIAKSVARPPSQPAPAAAANAAEDLEPYLKAADKAYGARQLARAKTIYTELLGVSPRLFTALLRLGLIEEQAGRHEEACHWLQRAVREDPASEEAAVALARSHLAAGEGEEAAAAVRAALERCGSGAGGKAGGKAAAKVAAKARRLKIELGRTLFKAGARQEGGALLTSILQQDMEQAHAPPPPPPPPPPRGETRHVHGTSTTRPRHVAQADALLPYGEACVALGQHDDALKIFLRLVTQRSDDSAVRRLLAASLGSKDGMALLRQQLAFDAKSASALAFLATIARDHSKLSASLELIAEAARLVPDASAYALQRAHTLEVELRYADALEAVREHCDANPQRAAAGVRCADVAALLPTREQCEAARWRPPSAPPSASPCKGTAEEAALRAAATEVAPDAGGELADGEGARLGKEAPPLELDLLALYFTALKAPPPPPSPALTRSRTPARPLPARPLPAPPHPARASRFAAGALCLRMPARRLRPRPPSRASAPADQGLAPHAHPQRERVLLLRRDAPRHASAAAGRPAPRASVRGRRLARPLALVARGALARTAARARARPRDRPQAVAPSRRRRLLPKGKLRGGGRLPPRRRGRRLRLWRDRLPRGCAARRRRAGASLPSRRPPPLPRPRPAPQACCSPSSGRATETSHRRSTRWLTSTSARCAG